MLIHKPTKTTYQNRLEAKRDMGHTNFNAAIKNREFIFITPRGKDEIIM